MYGLIGKMRTVEGKRDEVLGILTEGTGGMPGCLNYIVAKDALDPSPNPTCRLSDLYGRLMSRLIRATSSTNRRRSFSSVPVPSRATNAQSVMSSPA